MHLAPMGDAIQSNCTYNFEIIFFGFFSFRCALPSNAGFGASIGNARYKREKKTIDLIAAFIAY
jgi:hypothetical protein